MSGNLVVARALSRQGLEHCFGIIGVPIIELGFAIQAEGINYYGYRNEQGASYSAGAVGYLTGKPGICLCVSGPGMINAVTGLANAWANGWPMILIVGSSDLAQNAKGAFQECDQISLTKPYVKFAVKITSAKQIPQVISKAVRLSVVGRPGPVYIEIPGDVLTETIDLDSLEFPQFNQVLPLSLAPTQLIQQAVQQIKTSKNPLVIIGKGAGYSRAENDVLQLIQSTQLPFLPTPMGKGVVSDLHPCCAAPARSFILQNADLILLIGARLNWILHFGEPPRFNKNVKIIHIEICPEEFDTNVKGSVNLFGDIGLITKQLVQELQGYNCRQIQADWWKSIKEKIDKNVLVSQKLISQNDEKQRITYYSALGIIQSMLPKDFIYVGEGANTMDIGRTVINQLQPRTKLDAGTFGTMGIGIPFCIAAKCTNPQKPVVGILGDSAFGFSAMEIETAIRYNLPFVVIILNNNGIFSGVEDLPEEINAHNIPPNALKPNTRYEKLADAFGGVGLFVKTHNELKLALEQAFSKSDVLHIINVMIDPNGQRKEQEFSWLTRKDPLPKF
ncbi:2-hydroxyphytanoyl-CoA lyase (macronuclear) [Tetrahymena thermophila SB210]|uniref:2-hydroxyacyl-CoA lyase n=1 Tax=Tetrahymena thermophila (strain SB210) TaxID=312017 RepID=A4VE07_TETTS|nr:2-hydroxyphytanoyl-CoA lyase [Tetrahymena thermophila SB210]EDK31753.2 2-hydroxyphytanoyl-CoA lyase [Tetrahymena thermophila SB210]|eukprot:XP_001470771.2 2-hydroxyphytanoyl-CoA lyase [Tetrahymena thermophila SB210]